MGRIDLFESVFKAATRDVFEHQPPNLAKVLLITDLIEGESHTLWSRLQPWLSHLAFSEWEIVSGMGAADIGNLLDVVERHQPDLVCTYRNLHSNAWKWPYTLGDHAEVLTQVCSVPVLLLPRPDHPFYQQQTPLTTVMAMTDHLSGDHRLVNHAAKFTAPEGTLVLTHVEDDTTFGRYLETVAKIPTIDTDAAQHAIRTRLLRDPSTFIESCKDVLVAEAAHINVEPEVTMGHLISTTKKLVEDHDVDLLVMNTKDDDQLAMRGLAYPLAVELRQLPILLL